MPRDPSPFRSILVPLDGSPLAEQALPLASDIAQRRELGIDLVVMATHGRGGIRRAWLGSVADKLVRGAEVPVLVYRPAGRRKTKKRPATRARSRGHGAAQEGRR